MFPNEFAETAAFDATPAVKSHTQQSIELSIDAANCRVSSSLNRLFRGLGDVPVGVVVGGDVGASNAGGIGSDGTDEGGAVSGGRGIGRGDDGGGDNISRARNVHR